MTRVGGLFTVFLAMRAFASGCTALTGVEAISNGVPAFRKPKGRNAARTLVIMGGLSVIMFIGVTVLALATHARAYPDRPEERAHRDLEYGGEYKWRREGEIHLFNPKTVFKLQHATRSKRYGVFKEYTQAVDDQSEALSISDRATNRLPTAARPRAAMTAIRAELPVPQGERSTRPLSTVAPRSEPLLGSSSPTRMATSSGRSTPASR